MNTQFQEIAFSLFHMIVLVFQPVIFVTPCNIVLKSFFFLNVFCSFWYLHINLTQLHTLTRITEETQEHNYKQNLQLQYLQRSFQSYALCQNNHFWKPEAMLKRVQVISKECPSLFFSHNKIPIMFALCVGLWSLTEVCCYILKPLLNL